jgi:RNA polymerase sigma-70 factor, ECF subfamily
MDENELILIAKAGDLDAFNQIVLNHQVVAYNYACSILFDPPAAEDCTQEAFIKAFQSLSSFHGNSFRAWFLRIVRNVCYDELRRRKSHNVLSLEYKNIFGEEVERRDLIIDRSGSVEEIAEQNEVRSTLHRYLNDLPVIYRSVLLLVDILDFDYSEASTALNIPIGTVKSRLSRGRLALSLSLNSINNFLPQTTLVRGV